MRSRTPGVRRLTPTESEAFSAAGDFREEREERQVEHVPYAVARVDESLCYQKGEQNERGAREIPVGFGPERI